jgi:hypothetical protein
VEPTIEGIPTGGVQVCNFELQSQDAAVQPVVASCALLFFNTGGGDCRRRVGRPGKSKIMERIESESSKRR